MEPVNVELPEGALVVREIRIVQYLDPESGRSEVALGLEADDEDGGIDVVAVLGLLAVTTHALMYPTENED